MVKCPLYPFAIENEVPDIPPAAFDVSQFSSWDTHRYF